MKLGQLDILSPKSCIRPLEGKNSCVFPNGHHISGVRIDVAHYNNSAVSERLK